MAVKSKRKLLSRISISIVTIFIIINIAIIIQAYRLTHFVEEGEPLKVDYKPTITETIKIAIFGLEVPKPRPNKYPNRKYSTILIPESKDKHLEAWLLQTDSLSKGLVIGFHGYMDEKSSMLDRTYALLDMGYDILLVDCMGAGGSYGLQSTIGYKEAQNIKSAYQYAQKELSPSRTILVGFSMGAAAITRAIYEYEIKPDAIVLEATYGTFRGTVNKRLDKLNLPHCPISDIFVFWTGVINDYNAFDMNPQEYAKEIRMPALVLCGGKDPNIPIEESEFIYSQLTSRTKQIKIFPESVHESFLVKYPEEWKKTIEQFLETIN
ncbi:alpha/beta hydrolase [Dysgonomonas sp. 511]|uniref:alpha/beta hydrolase n=1 Tax=Dysgonomonas sp. 511 TaxID=2302930 RepID=UPI0013D599ED|nr:alpha/beta hydrolase [Dysgonomonas sp. 511]NDV79053.1 hypothetical protein [Dysgonomonas sp. 511]